MGLNLRRANVVLGGGVTYSKVGVVVSEGVVRLWDSSGNVLASGIVASVTRVGLREHLVTLDTGEAWAISEVRGCGCGE